MIIRLAEPGDALAVARVHVESWQAAYRGLIADAYLDSLRPEDRAAHYDFTHTDPTKPRTIVVLERGILQGFATTTPSRDTSLPTHGELAALYVHPDCWNRGLGLALIQSAREHLATQGHTDALLWILDGNQRGARFYERDGWTHDKTTRTDIVHGVPVNELRYQRSL
jgi:GNAT superfamily N-acetyltransferase